MKINHRKCRVKGCIGNAKHFPVMTIRSVAGLQLMRVQKVAITVCARHINSFRWKDLVPEAEWKQLEDHVLKRTGVKPDKKSCKINWGTFKNMKNGKVQK